MEDNVFRLANPDFLWALIEGLALVPRRKALFR